ncbi:MAG: hypothetical protein BWK76_22505 [Desulfobulbaceae bacterium A2]|nr:MAG: hypothetical protein BWK76_22505 [Desulfobulbaceae bacterium A2]
MSLFDRLVDEALRNQHGLATLRTVVEKELLHHDILRVMSSAGLLVGLTFMGGTCLRACYGSSRLSEDMDFTGGLDFNRTILDGLGPLLVERLQEKYGLPVEVDEPRREAGNVATWKLRIQVRPGRNDLPSQRINIDIYAIPSHDARPMMLRNHYGVDMGTGGLILRAQSREEILADKIVALALRPNRLKNRDLWDIAWLCQHGVMAPLSLVPGKLLDHHCEQQVFLSSLEERRLALHDKPALAADFRRGMRRFLPAPLMHETVEQQAFWQYLTTLIAGQCQAVHDFLTSTPPAQVYKMDAH